MAGGLTMGYCRISLSRILGAPQGGVFSLDAENASFDLEGQLVGLAVGSPAPIVEGIETTFFVAVEDLVAGHA
jgi:hypothetical protein